MDKKINDIIKFAYQFSEFYKEMIDERGIKLNSLLNDWNNVPIVTKNDLINTRKFIMPYCFVADLPSGKIGYKTTSGSTGKCLPIYWRQSDNIKSMFSLCIARKKHYNIISSDKFCYFYTLQGIGNNEKPFIKKRNELGFSKTNLSQGRIKEIYSQILEFQPVWMVLQPSIAILLSRFVVENDVYPIESLRYIELTGEMCRPESRKFIEYAFECTTASQYGAHEVNSIAYECSCGNLHIMTDNVFVEIIKNGEVVSNGEEGEIVVTSLTNYVMPFVRYNIGDYGILHPNTCGCGSEGKILELTKGRKNDNILFKDGTIANAYEFVRIFECINYQIDGQVFQYRIVQINYDVFEVHIVTDEKEETIRHLFNTNQINPKLAQSIYHFYFHNQLLPDESTGKLSFFECVIPE